MDIREHYERKLERANNLYMELSVIMLQLEMREKELIKYVPGPLFVLIDLGLSVGQDVTLVQVTATQNWWLFYSSTQHCLGDVPGTGPCHDGAHI